MYKIHLRLFIVAIILTVLVISLFGCNKDNAAGNNAGQDTNASGETAAGTESAGDAGDAGDTGDTGDAGDATNATSDATNATSDATSGAGDAENGSSLRDKNYLTSVEAVQIAYEEAKKWSDDALLKSMTIGSQLSMHYDWANSDMAYHWTVDFVSPEKMQMMFVYVNYGKVDNTLVKEDNLKNLPPDGHPNDHPLISLKEANAIAVQNGGIYGIMPVNADYSTYGYSTNEFPSWMIVYRVPTPDGKEEMHFYYINAENGKISDVFYKNDDGDLIEQAALQVKGQDLSELKWMQDLRYVVIKFFTLINEGSADKAAEMMDEAMAPNAGTKSMWIESLSSIAGHEFISGGFVTEDEDNWTQDTQRFEIRITIPEDCDCEQYGWDHGTTKRWMTLKKHGDVWKVHELSTSP